MEVKNNAEEINLVEFVNVIIKRKKIVITCLILGLFFALGVFLIQKKPIVQKSEVTYISQVTLQIGNTGYQPIENIDGLTRKINAGFYGYSDSVDLKASEIPGTMLVTIKSSDPNQQESKNVLTHITAAILLDHDALLGQYKNNIEEKIRNVQYANNRFLQMGRDSQSLQILVFNLQDDLSHSNASKVIKDSNTSITTTPLTQAEKKFKPIFVLLIGAILGLFVGVCLVFIMSWWNKNKSSIQF